MPQAAPYMIAQVLSPGGAVYDILEGQWFCTDVADATYYCVHNWYNASGAFSGIVDGSGYAGFQCKDRAPWTILSLWANEHGFPTIEYAPGGSIARPFGGEGRGCQVLVPYPWQAGRWYTMRVQARSEAGKTLYEQWVRPEGGEWKKQAVISYPKPNLGFSWDCFFLEDWIGNDLLRSCRLRGYYARKRGWLWTPLDGYHISNRRGSLQNVATDCGFGLAGKDAVWISSGGGCSLSLPAMPHRLKVSQPKKPATAGMLG